jgi:hypothetical protein
VPRSSRCYVGVAARQPYKAETTVNHVAAAGVDEIIKGRGGAAEHRVTVKYGPSCATMFSA